MELSPLARDQAVDAPPALDPPSSAPAGAESLRSNSRSPTLINDLDPVVDYDGQPTERGFGQRASTYVKHACALICSERINVLLLFVPVGLAVGYLDVDPVLNFILSALAIIPLAIVISSATEVLASRLGDTTGALLNVTFGNAAELIIFFVALAKNQIRIVQASLLGSVLTNLLVVLGTALLLGGLRFEDGLRDRPAARTGIALLTLGLLLSIFPIVIWTATSHQSSAKVTRTVLTMSRGLSFGLIFIYLLYLTFQLKSKATGRSEHDSSAMHDCEAMPRMAEASHRPRLHKLRSGTSRSRWLQWVSAIHSRDHRGSYTTAPQADEAAIPLPPWTSKPHEPYSSVASDYAHPGNMPDLDSGPKAGEHDYRQNPHYLARRDSQMSDTSSTVAGDEAIMSAVAQAERLPPSPPSTRSASPVSESNDTSHHYLLPDSSHADPPSPHPRYGVELFLRRRDTLKDLRQYRKAQSDQSSTPTAVALGILIVATGLASLCSELTVDAIPFIVESWGVSHIFLGFIILPVVGNAAEHVTAAKLAMHNKIVLAKSVAVESSTQVLVLIAPLMVLLGWARNRDMSLQFDAFEIASVLIASTLASIVVSWGKGGWKQGVVLLASFGVIALGAIFYPTPSESHGRHADAVSRSLKDLGYS